MFLDGQDIRELPLALLRSGVTVISQDAHLFSGNVRETIDPLGQVGLVAALGFRVGGQHLIWDGVITSPYTRYARLLGEGWVVRTAHEYRL